MTQDAALKMVQDTILEEKFKAPSEYVLATKWKDLRLDSLDVVEVCLKIEGKIGKELDVQRVDDLQTVGDLVILLERQCD